MKVLLRNPRREVDVPGPSTIGAYSERSGDAARRYAQTAFLFGFLDRAHGRFADDAREERASLGTCRDCGASTTGDVCAFCRLRERARQDG